MSKEELKPCPFCGSKVTVQVIPPHTHKLTKWIPDCNGKVIIECKCGCSIMRDTEEEAIIHWNTRKPIEKMVEQLEQQIKQYRTRAGQYEKRGAEIEYRRMFSKACSYEHAVKIVKRGGVNDD